MRIRIDDKGYLSSSGVRRSVACALLMFCGFSCAPSISPREETKSPAPLAAVSSPALLPEPPRERPSESPAFLAEQLAKHTRERWSKVPAGVEFNGFHELAQLGTRKEGLRALSALWEKEGGPAFQAEVRAQLSRETSPLRKDIETLKSALSKPRITAPFDFSNEGAVEPEHLQSFEDALRTLSVLPDLAHQLKGEEERFDGYLFALKLGRALARDAALESHYLAGLEIQEKAMEYLSSWIEGGALTGESAPALVARLQMEISSPQELEWVWDTEHLLRVQALRVKTLDPLELEREQLALAERYLKTRTYLGDPQPPAKGFRFQERPDFLPTLGRSRKAQTQLGVLELKAALQAYRLGKELYPESLEELVPSYLPRIPTDYLSQSGAFEYQRHQKGYLLISRPAGEDEKTVW